MKKLGKKYSQMYDNPTSKDAEWHPEVNLPGEMFGKTYKIGDECHLHCKGTIESMSKEGYRVKLTHGEELGDDKKASLLKSAKTNT